MYRQKIPRISYGLGKEKKKPMTHIEDDILRNTLKGNGGDSVEGARPLSSSEKPGKVRITLCYT